MKTEFIFYTTYWYSSKAEMSTFYYRVIIYYFIYYSGIIYEMFIWFPYLYSIMCCITRTSIRVTRRALIVTPPSTEWKEEKAVSKKMETCVSGGKRKISDVSDSSKIKLSENNDHRPKLKSRKHESCVALGFTANVVGTTTTTKPVSCLTTLGYIWQCEAQHGRTSTYTGEVKLSASS